MPSEMFRLLVVINTGTVGSDAIDEEAVNQEPLP